MRLLFYATNGLGLGHVTRLLATVRALRRKDPSHEILFLTRCEAGPYPKEDDVFTIRIPGPSRARSSGLTPKSYYQMVHPLLWQTVSSFDPHLLVVDTFPAGPEEELAPLLKWPIRKAFVYRDSRAETREIPSFRKALESYQMILVAHEAGTVSLPFFLMKDPRVHFTGIISDGWERRDDRAGTRKEIRSRLGVKDEPVALITLGGGGDETAFGLLPSLTEWLRKKNMAFFVATGPLRREIPSCITAREWLPVWPLAPWLPGFDMVIANAGYNTVSELRAARLPSLLIPFERDLDDQKKRADDAANEGWALAISGTSQEALFDGLERLFYSIRDNKDPNGKSFRDSQITDGSGLAAELLLSLLSGKHSARSTHLASPSDRETPRVSTL